MKHIRSITLALAFSVSTAKTAHAQDRHVAHAPHHGGLVAEVNHMEFELVMKPDTLILHLSEHEKPVDVSKGNAKITLMSGADTQEVALIPNGDHFTASGKFAAAKGSKAVAQVKVGGRSYAPRFVWK